MCSVLIRCPSRGVGWEVLRPVAEHGGSGAPTGCRDLVKKVNRRAGARGIPESFDDPPDLTNRADGDDEARLGIGPLLVQGIKLSDAPRTIPNLDGVTDQHSLCFLPGRLIVGSVNDGWRACDMAVLAERINAVLRHSRAPLVQAGALPNSQSPTPGIGRCR
jgi:hypothetical protein